MGHWAFPKSPSDMQVDLCLKAADTMMQWGSPTLLVILAVSEVLTFKTNRVEDVSLF